MDTVSIRIVLRRKLYDFIESRANQQQTRPQCLLEELLEDAINRKRSPEPNIFQRVAVETAVTSCALSEE